MKTIEFYFDFGSPTAFIAHKQLQKLAAKYQANLVYEPMLLGAVHKATNNTPPGAVAAKGRYMVLQDLPRFVQRYGIEFNFNPNFPINTLKLMRGCYAAKELSCFEKYVDIIYDGMWIQKLHLGKDEVLLDTLNNAGLNAEKMLELVQTDSVKTALKENTDKAVSKGAFGAPTMYLGKEMYFGQDRLDFVEEALQE